MRQIEVLAPAGSMECLKAAILAGADAVYLGGSMFGARAYAKNLTEEEMLEAIDYVHIHGRKLYMTVNTLLKDTELHKLYDFLSPYYKQGLDGVIVQDVGVVSYLRRQFPDLPVHASTQMTLTSPYGAKLMKEQGLTRVVPARELSLKEVKEIKAETGLEVECFVHGAMCYSYSGQCLLSSMIGGRSGNRGQCAQPCRLPYSLADGKPMDLMSLKDMCTIKMIPELIEAGVDSFKIEGRMKQPDYVYTVASMYRKYVDLYFEKGRDGFKVTEQDLRKLESAYKRRGYTEGYYKQHNGKQMLSLKRPDQKEDLLLVPDEKCQEPITGRLLLRKGQKSKLYLKHWEFEVTVEGPVCETAMKQPLDEDRVRKQMKKLGNTEFAMGNLEVEMDSDIFLPMQELNQLRRAGVEVLEKAILEPYYRNSVAKMAVLEDEKISQEAILDESTLENISGSLSSNRKLSALVRSFEQLEVLAKYKQVEEIYIESPLCFDAEAVKFIRLLAQDGRKIFAALPYIFRRPAVLQLKDKYQLLLDNYDGVLIRNFESLKMLSDLNYPKEIQGDYNLYIFNKLSKKWMKEAGIVRSTAPVELNEKELGKLDISQCTFIGYGYQPVMITAGCIQKNSKECNKKNSKLFIKDRYRKEFFVQMCCDYCYNVIYNTAPLYLADQSALLKRLNPQSLRLDFSQEKAGEVRKIIEAYDSAMNKGVDVKISGEFTRGHIKKGSEVGGKLVNIIVEVSKYLMIILMSIYTYTCFSIFGYYDPEDKQLKLREQNILMFLIHAVAFMVMYLETDDFKVLVLYVMQVVLFIATIILYTLIYPRVSRLVVNNMCMLMCIGMIMLTRLDYDKAYKQYLIAAFAVGLSLVIPVIIRKLKLLSEWRIFYGIAGIVMLAVVVIIGRVSYGAMLGFTVAGINVQPSEVVKIIFVFFVASSFKYSLEFKNIVVTTAVAAFHVLILVVSKDLGAALIIFVVYLTMLYVATHQPLYLLGGLGSGAVASVAAYYLFDHVKTRVTVWKDPFACYDNGGYQVAQSLFAIGTGGWFGTGLYQGAPDTIPVAAEDFIFSAISEEMGLIFALCMILVCVSCYIMFLNIAMQLRKMFYKMVALGLGTCYIFQVFLTIGGVTKFIPSTGVTLPLVSYGGSSLVSTLIMFAIIQGLYILREDEEEIIERKKKEKLRAERSREEAEEAHRKRINDQRRAKRSQEERKENRQEKKSKKQRVR